MDIFEKFYRFDKADEVRAAGVYPYFHALESRQDTEVIMEGKRRIMLGSNNYLGLTTHPEVIAAGIKAFEEYGSGCSGSRFLNGTLNLHLDLEKELADFLRKEEVMTFSTGFQSNLGIISTVVGKNDYVIMDRENHASLYDGCKLSYGTMLRYRHNDMAGLRRCLEQVPENAGALIVTDGVFSMGGDIANLPEICALAEEFGARVMVDDAHGLGVIGEGGRGTASYFGLEDKVDIYMGTFSKSLASLGGYMASEHKVVDAVKHTCRPFIFSASMTPANAACALKALQILKAHPELPETLQERALYMRKVLKEKQIAMRSGGGEQIPIIPIYTYDMLRTLAITTELYKRGVYVNSSLPPAVGPNECLLRTSLMATHTHELIDEAVDIIAEVLKEFEV